MRFSEIADLSGRVAETRRRREKIGLLAACLRRMPTAELPVGAAYLTGYLPQGRIGVGAATLRRSVSTTVAASPALALLQVHEALDRIAGTTGSGSSAKRQDLLGELFGRGTPREQDFLLRLLLGELRQGALEGLMADAIGQAAEIPVAAVRRALMLAGDPAAVAVAALTEGTAGLAGFTLKVLQPVKPMLAQSAEDVADALQRLGSAAAFEFKLDGARVQVHKSGKDVRVFTRRLNEVTSAVPEIVEALQCLSVRDVILDGEALALRPDGTPQLFQTTMRRFGRKIDVAQMRQELPILALYFDCLHLDGEDLIDRTADERFRALADQLDAECLVPRLVTRDAAQARHFLEHALRLGHEGVMAKALDTPYEAGNRGAGWLKVKRTHTLDLVVLAAEWGHGRRSGWLSNLHLGARDSVAGGFVMLGKTFKGMTDQMLAWQTERLQTLAMAREDATVHVRPELVVEVLFNDIQASPHYPAGLALRFARVKRYRPDKTAANADTIQTVRALFEQQMGPEARIS